MVLFVCTGNICRSPIAEGYFNQKAKEKGLDIYAESAGTSAYEGDRVSALSVKVTKKLYNIDISTHRARAICEEDVKESSLILTMSRTHKHILISNFPEHRAKIFTISEYVLEPDMRHFAEDVKDPFMSNEYTYSKVAQQIADYVDKVIESFV